MIVTRGLGTNSAATAPLVTAGLGIGSIALFDGYHPFGRIGINHAQPYVGIDYPLVGPPSYDIAELLADLTLTYEDPSDYDSSEDPFTLPFSISWLAGFGLGAATGSPSSPTHAADIVIVDADDRVVFDSTAGSLLVNRAWGPRLWVYTWKNTTAHLTVVRHTKWSPDDDRRTYSSAFNPDRAVLHARCVKRLPKRVRSFTVLTEDIRDVPVIFRGEYNVELTYDVDTEDLRKGYSIVIDATPGSGQGIYPDCEGRDLFITSINNVTPTQSGHFYLTAEDCYFVRQPTTVLVDEPRTTYPTILQIPYSNIETDLPDPDAGTTTDAAGWPPSKEYAHLYIGNDCVPCCDCADYGEAAQFIVDEVAAYQALATEARDAATAYHDNRARFLQVKACVTQHPLRIAMQPQVCPYLDVVVQFCNQTDQCVNNLEVLVWFDAGDGTGSEVPGFTQIRGARYAASGHLLPITERYAMDGTWPEYRAYWEYVPPYGSVSVRMRLLFDNCGGTGDVDNLVPYVVTGNATASIDGSPVYLPESEDEVLATATITLRCPPSPGDLIVPQVCVLPQSPDG